MDSNFVVVKQLIPQEFCHYFTHILLRNSDLKKDHSDAQVKDALSLMDHEIVFETLQERVWETIEQVTKVKLLPTSS